MTPFSIDLSRNADLIANRESELIVRRSLVIPLGLDDLNR